METRLPSLEDYLSSDYLTNKQDIESLDAAIGRAGNALVATRSSAGWPYKFKVKDGAPAPGSASHGTLAMVLSAVGRMVGVCSLDEQRMDGRFKTKDLSEAFGEGLKALRVSLSAKRAVGITSGTFGDNNPLTLSHISDLYASIDQEQFADAGKDIEESIKKAKKRLFDVISENFGERDLLEESGKRTYYQNSFIPLRAILAARQLDKGVKLDSQRRFFETALHEQLSFSAIPDSRFDPAELVFSLEGLLICAKHAVDPAMFHRVLEVLSEKQNTSAHWRPNKPFLAAETGSIVLPLSVEVANSLMRSIATMDQGRYHNTYTSSSLPLLRRFWGWLQARAVRADINGSDCLGWHSEHVNEPDLIHPWDTSQVVEFMLAYRAFLEREIRQTTLLLSGLDWKPVGVPLQTSPLDHWEEVTKKFEPSIGAANGDQVYGRIGRDFVEGWSKGRPESFSMIIYGPPGTGKTTIAKELSKTLGMPLINVTVSDFLGSGGANVEARAKAIFTTLEHQRNAVILFDEIDSFLLDRDTKRYSEQDSLFQFLTPGMLTKFHHLRDAERSIFIVATNYENRIDPAIKRTGRIDHMYLFPLPDRTRRKSIMVAKKFPEEDFTDEVASASVFFGYGDLVKVAEKVGSNEPASASAEFVKLPRSSSLMHYVRRLNASDEDFAPAEFDDMVRLAEEAGALHVIKEAHTALENQKTNGKLSSNAQKYLERVAGTPQ